jgi:glycosyltransferase involved in cell wall biosynthesis
MRSILYNSTGDTLPRVALFQAFLRFHSSTAFSALMLARAGYRVDVFLHQIDESTPTDILAGSESIFVHYIERAGRSSKSRGSPYSRAVRRILNLFRLWVGSEKNLIPNEVLQLTYKIMREGSYRALIGIDKGGLLWAGTIARRHHIPLIYSSLELYTSDHKFLKDPWARRLKTVEEEYHKHCWATVVQDQARGKVLLEDNHIRREMRMLYVPVSRLGGPITQKHRWLQSGLKLNHEQIIILSYGYIAEHRLSLELARIAQSFPENWGLVFHGFGSDSTIRKISEIDTNQKVRVSLNMVKLSDEPAIMGSAQISLVLYSSDESNDWLTGFSSEKLALSLQCGIPVIVSDYPSFSHIREEQCGVLVNDLSEIPNAISRILNDYENYRTRAFATFKKYYQFEANFEKVLKALEELR